MAHPSLPWHVASLCAALVALIALVSGGCNWGEEAKGGNDKPVTESVTIKNDSAVTLTVQWPASGGRTDLNYSTDTLPAGAYLKRDIFFGSGDAAVLFFTAPSGKSGFKAFLRGKSTITIEAGNIPALTAVG